MFFFKLTWIKAQKEIQWSIINGYLLDGGYINTIFSFFLLFDTLKIFFNEDVFLLYWPNELKTLLLKVSIYFPHCHFCLLSAIFSFFVLPMIVWEGGMSKN